MRRRRRSRLWSAWHRASFAVKAIIILLLLVLAASLAFYLLEKHMGAAYSSYPKALKGLFILFFSGFDVEQPPASAMGFLAAMFVMLGGIAFLTFLIGESSAAFVENRLKRRRGMKKVKLKDHIVICNWNQRGRAIIDHLLSEDIEEPRHVVVLAELEESPYDDPMVYFVRGNPSRHEDRR